MAKRSTRKRELPSLEALEVQAKKTKKVFGEAERAVAAFKLLDLPNLPKHYTEKLSEEEIIYRF